MGMPATDEAKPPKREKFLTVENLAAIAYDAGRRLLGELGAPADELRPWEEMDQIVKDYMTAETVTVLDSSPLATAASLHNSDVEHMVEEGFTPGEEYDAQKKTSPLCRRWEALPDTAKASKALLFSVIKGLAPFTIHTPAPVRDPADPAIAPEDDAS